ncbi:GP88 family protein [Paludisphaera soli]|uniref:GP88 family protein n=1 Tax=Paludisphaera soli TaxID=2712865 RepID=UPI0013EA695A|nr:hypothetical protein [Paludisphaera soli]
MSNRLELLAPAPGTRPPLLCRGNSKLGRELIWTFSTPAVAACPGATPACRASCYARSGRFAFPSVKTRHARNLARAEGPGFVADLVDQVRRDFVRVVRVHGSGDFHSAGYVGLWAEAARICRSTVFFAYTRSWRAPEIRGALADFAGLPNVRLWYSGDRDSGPPPRDPGVRTAWMIGPGEPPGSVPASADLAFRVRRSGPLKRANCVLVCPYEQAVPRSCPPISCERCRICFDRPSRPPARS